MKEIDLSQLTKIKDSTLTGKVRFNIQAAEALKAAWAELEEKGLLDRVVSWDGAYSGRLIRGSTNRLSGHACGTAFDINAAFNPFGKTPTPKGEPGSVIELVGVFENHGFIWGGNYRSPDATHFEYALAAFQ